MPLTMQPSKWYDVYPQGTREGDEEAKFFKVLARDPQYKWRSTSAIAKGAGLSKARTEEIIQKYVKLGIVIPSQKNENSWAYWERVPKSVAAMMDNRSIGQKDKDARISSWDDEDLADAMDAGLDLDDDFDDDEE